MTTLGRTIIVHAKLTIIDDTLLRIGSANINNRSFGFDTECDLSLEASGSGSAANRAEIIRLRNVLLSHWLGCPHELINDAIAKHGGVTAALESLRNSGYCRLRPIQPEPLKPLRALIAAYHLGDPRRAEGSPATMEAQAGALAAQGAGCGRENPKPSAPPKPDAADPSFAL